MGCESFRCRASRSSVIRPPTSKRLRTACCMKICSSAVDKASLSSLLCSNKVLRRSRSITSWKCCGLFLAAFFNNSLRQPSRNWWAHNSMFDTSESMSCCTNDLKGPFISFLNLETGPSKFRLVLAACKCWKSLRKETLCKHLANVRRPW